MSDTQFDDEILDSNAISPTDEEGNPVPVTIPIALAPGVTVVYTTRLGGVSHGDFGDCNLGGKGGDDPQAILANRVSLAKSVGCGLSLVSQVHSGRAVDVDASWHLNTPFGFDVSGTPGEVTADGEAQAATVVEADGQVTSRAGVALGMFAADCLPVLMADAQAGVIGAAHCGRKGLQRGIIGATIDAMVAKGAAPERIAATLGPCICGDCYEVGDAIADEFDAQFPGTFTLTRFGGPASTSPRPPAWSSPRRVFPPTASSTRARASTPPLNTCMKTRSLPRCAPPTAKASLRSPTAGAPCATACARWRTRCGTPTAAPRSPARRTRDACSP